MAKNTEKRTNYLNEEIKRREAEEAARRAEQNDADEPLKLDDTQRVKVLSPGRLVAKRFFRNKLAMVGLGILILMFIFSFLCPLFYPYGQTEIFYKYDYLNINYASAARRTEYTSYVLDPTLDIHYSVKNKMTSFINTMNAQGLESMAVSGDDGSAYTVNRLGEGVYELCAGEAETVATYAAEARIGEFDNFSGKLKNVSDAPEGLEEAAAAAKKAGQDSFSFDGAQYTLTAGPNKTTSYLNRTGSDTLSYTGADLGADFSAAFFAARDAGETMFTFDGTAYSILSGAEGYTVTLPGEQSPAMISSIFVFDAYESGKSFSDTFKAEALEALYGGGRFTEDGQDYELRRDGESWMIYAADGSEVAMISDFVVRRYSGEDTLSLAFKQETDSLIAEMEDEGRLTGSFVFDLPEMDSEGVYVLDEDGNPSYRETELTVENKNGQYVLKCEMITNLIDIYAAPSREHPFGTDADGMDILARMMYGGRVSLMVGFVVVILESVLGVILGGIAGFFGGWVDTVFMRLVDIFYCIPTYPILIIMGAYFDAARLGSYQRLIWMMAILGVLGWAGVARLVRGQILSLREQEFMVAAEATGIRAKRRIFRHLVPNVMPQLIVSATMGLGSVIITESTLSFLGLGVKRPLATWGTMINAITSSNENLVRYAYIWIPVGLLICLTVIAFNFVGDGLRDAFDPKMKQ